MDKPHIAADAWIDLANLDCYLALRHLRSALSEVPFRNEVTVTPRPFLQHREAGTTLEREIVTSATNLDERAADDGIRIEPSALLPSSTKAASQLVLWAVQHDESSGTSAGPNSLALRLSEAIMRALFEVGANIESPETLISIAQDLTIDGKEASIAIKDEYLGIQVQQAYEMGLYLGVTNPPVLTLNEAFVVDGSQTQDAYLNIIKVVWNNELEARKDK